MLVIHAKVEVISRERVTRIQSKITYNVEKMKVILFSFVDHTSHFNCFYYIFRVEIDNQSI